ncbi:unnamed protein product [Penicillium pancosmium]
MLHILNLPVEIIICVFESLGDIDDALHFARCSTYLYHVFNPVGVRLAIFKSIIARASHHENDVELSQRANLYGQFSEDLYETMSLPIAENPTYRKSLASKFLSPLTCGDNIPAEIVWDVVCRWQGMRVLCNLYCNSAINKAYSTSTMPYPTSTTPYSRNQPQGSQREEAMAREPCLQPPSDPIHASVEEMSTIQRRLSYQRFYKALTIYWTSVEIFWLAKTRPVSSGAEAVRAFQTVKGRWTNNPTRCLSDKIDILEVTYFVGGFLGRKAFDLFSIPAWIEGLGEDVFEFYASTEDDTELDNWVFFVETAFQYLRPPHIIELLLWMWNSSTWNLNRPMFLQRLGMFDTSAIQEDEFLDEDSDRWYSHEWKVPLTYVEEDVENSVAAMQDDGEAVALWREYRENRWPLDARGRVFFEDPTPKEVLIQILYNQMRI